MDREKQIITWSQFDKDSRLLAAALLKGEPNLHGVVGIARGGLVATAIISNMLKIRDVKTVAVASYHEYEHRTAELLGSVDTIADGKGWVFIDDLVDTGDTARLIKKRYPQALFAVPYIKPKGAEWVDYYVQEIEQDVWLEFPWE